MFFPSPEEYIEIKKNIKLAADEKRRKEIDAWFTSIMWGIQNTLLSNIKNGKSLKFEVWFNGIDDNDKKYDDLKSFRKYVEKFIKSKPYKSLQGRAEKDRWKICVINPDSIKEFSNFLCVDVHPMVTLSSALSDNVEDGDVRDDTRSKKRRHHPRCYPKCEFSGATGDGLPSDIGHALAILDKLNKRDK